MEHAIDAQRFLPRGALVGAAVLLGLTLAGAGLARLLHFNATPLPAARVVQQRSLAFRDRADGGIDVLDAAQGGAVTYVVQPNTGGFVRGALRSLARARRADGVGAAPPFTLTRWSDGRFTLDDPATGAHLNLEVFGASNSRPFAEIFLSGPPAGPTAR